MFLLVLESNIWLKLNYFQISISKFVWYTTFQLIPKSNCDLFINSNVDKDVKNFKPFIMYIMYAYYGFMSDNLWDFYELQKSLVTWATWGRVCVRPGQPGWMALQLWRFCHAGCFGGAPAHSHTVKAAMKQISEQLGNWICSSVLGQTRLQTLVRTLYKSGYGT